MNHEVRIPSRFKRLASCLILTAVFAAACTAAGPPKQVGTIDPYRSELVPEGWIDSYEYTETLGSYLQKQAVAAAAVDKKPLLYVFDDRFDDCRVFRRRAKKGPLLDLLQDKYIIMLNHEFVHSRMRSARKPEGSGLDNVGLLVALDEFGRARVPVIDMFRSYSDHSANPNRQISRLERSFAALYDSDN